MRTPNAVPLTPFSKHPVTRRRTDSASAGIEPLEARIAPAVLNVVGGLLTFTAGVGIGNSVTLAISGANYSINDSQEPITLGSGAVTAGFTGGGTNTVLGPNTAVSSLSFLLGDQNDQFQVTGLTDPLTVDGQAGTADTAFVTGAINPGGALTFTVEGITVSQTVSGATTVAFAADTMAINAVVGASGRVTLAPQTAARPISLGAEVAGSLSLTDAELDRFTTPGVLQIGTTTSGALTIGGALSLTNAATLSLDVGGPITQTAALTVASLRVVTTGGGSEAIILDNAGNDVDTIAASSAFTLELVDADDLVIGTVDGLAGISMIESTFIGPIPIVFPSFLSAGATTQAAGARIAGGFLELAGAGPFTLNDPANTLSDLTGTVAGAVSYTDVGDLNVSDLATTNSPIAITALAGSLTVGGSGVGAGTSTVSLTAGSAGADRAITLLANAGLSGSGVTLTADAMNLGASVNATSFIALEPFEATTVIALGDADGAGTLGLTSAELGFLSAPTLDLAADSDNAITVTGVNSLAGITSFARIGGSSLTGSGGIVTGTLSLDISGNIELTGASDVNTLSLTFRNPGPVLTFADADGFALGQTSSFRPKDFTIVTFQAGTATVTFGNALGITLSGNTPGVDQGQVVVQGQVAITGAFSPTVVGALPFGTDFVIVSNDGVDPITGNFFDLPEGATLTVGGVPGTISYVGGDGNDVVFSTLPQLAITLANGGKTATFRDIDGDLVTVKTTKGAFDGSEFFAVADGIAGGGQLRKLTLDADFAGANITITAKRTAEGGNGFVNVGFLDATGVDLGAVSIAGDLSRLTAGTTGETPAKPALKSLTVESIGLLGASTLQVGSVTTGVSLVGALPKLTVRGDMRAGIFLDGADAGKLGAAIIGGSLVPGGGSLNIIAEGGIGSLTVGGDIRNVSTGGVVITSHGTIGKITVGGSIIGLANTNSVRITALGQLTAPAAGIDLAIKSLTVRGSVEFANVSVGSVATQSNADASIGSIAVGGDWIASAATASTVPGTDGQTGTADDVKQTATRDNPAIFSTIGSFTVKGQALGTAGDTSDMFGIVAERIGKAEVGGRTFVFAKTSSEAFFAAPTLDGAGTENPMFDFTIRELGSTTPVPAFGGPNLTISTDGKTATFVDVDGDLVTVKRSAGAFVAGDFVVVPTASGGGLLQLLTVTPAPNNAATDLTISAKLGPDGGNGFVNVGRIIANTTDLGKVTVAGELQDLDAGDSDDVRDGLGSLTVQSLGTVAGTSPSGDEINGAHGIGKITVKTDVRRTSIFANNQDSGDLGSLTVGGSVIGREIQAASSIGTIKIGGSVRGGATIQATDRIGAIGIGGDLVGGTIEIFAQSAGPAKGLDVALASLAVGGTIETTNILLGRNNNADASIGALSAGREWIASSVLAGATTGADTFTGTADDAKVTLGGPVDVTGRFSTIASIVIKGQALGSTATGDSFGIVAEQIAKAQIGAVKFVFDKGERDAADAFALAPTGPGATGLASDFFLREITV